jgi:DNA-binding TFAR19-related protein (PDSD5 family)
METKNFDELIKQKLAEIEALKQEKEEMERAKKANIENLQKEKGDLLIQIKSAKEKLDTLEIAKKDIQDQIDVLTKELQNDSDRLVDIECQLKKYEGGDVEVDVSKENSLVDTNVILDEVHEEQPEKEAIPLIPALEEENVVVEEEKSVFEQALEATVQQTQKDATHYKYHHVFDDLQVKDKEIYGIIDQLEKRAEYSFKETFTTVGVFLDKITDRILEKNNYRPEIVASCAEDMITRINVKTSFILKNKLVEISPNNVSYKCGALIGCHDEYLKTNVFMFLFLLYKSATLDESSNNGTWPLYNDEVMLKCIKSIHYLLKATNI